MRQSSSRRVRAHAFPAFFLCLLALLMSGHPAWSQDQSLDAQSPMHIEADKVVYGQNERKLEFVGQVHVQRPDFQLWCDHMEVMLTSADQDQGTDSDRKSQLGSAGQVRKIVAVDNVRLNMEQRQATSDRAKYYARESKIIMVGNVKLKENRNTVRGHRVTFYLQDGRSEIESQEGDRVKAVFFPEEESEEEQ